MRKGFAPLIIVLVAAAIVLGSGVSYYYAKKRSVLSQSPTQSRPPGPGIPCAQEAKFCPDGGVAGRTGPNCELAACPGSSQQALVPAQEEQIIQARIARKTYRTRDNAIYYWGEKFGADAATFKDLGDNWGKDKSGVYYLGRKVGKLDPATTKIFPYFYVSDKENVYTYTNYAERGLLRLPGAHPSTFSVLNYGYAKDENNVYWREKQLANADVFSFTPLRAENYSPLEGLANSPYSKDKKNVWYRSSPIQNADAQSFISLGREYARDKNKAYYWGKVILGADANSFVSVGSFGKDKNHVYEGGKILKAEIDPASFTVVNAGNGAVAIKDSKRVYSRCVGRFEFCPDYTLVSEADPASFQYVGVCECSGGSCASYLRDKNKIFIDNKPLNAIDVSSFQYYGMYELAGGEILSHGSYAKDRNAIFYSCGHPLAGADKSTFRYLMDGYAKDANKVWHMGREVKLADVTTIQPLGGGYAKDKNRAYFGAAVIGGADVATFVVVKENVSPGQYQRIFAKDKNVVYADGRPAAQGVKPENCTANSIEECLPV